MNCYRISLLVLPLLVIGILCPQCVWGHGSTIDVLADEDRKLHAFFFANGTPTAEPTELIFHVAASLIVADGPGLGVLNRANRIDVGSDLGMDVERELLYWNGNEIESASHTLTVYSPDGKESYQVNSDSAPQSGITWGTYDGELFWDEHGLFVFDTINAPIGLYGLAMTLTSSNYESSDPFLIPFRYRSVSRDFRGFDQRGNYGNAWNSQSCCR